ncbi:hypothetical protein HY029_04875 [Candidatus Gottesmanbacteria bacterium]|nr:hypothetical protein [Candidatus Gottesmanbacteria bacterium]
MEIIVYNSLDQPGVKKFVLGVLREFGFNYDKKLDYDLEDPEKYYPDTGGIFYVIKKENKIIGTIAIKIKDKESRS